MSVRLVTSGRAYTTELEFDVVERSIENGVLIPVRDDQEPIAWLNPAAIVLVRRMG